MLSPSFQEQFFHQKIIEHTYVCVLQKVISFGATRVVVPGNFPIGCLPIYQTAFQTNISIAYDENQCLKQLNDLATYHNEQLQQAIHKLQRKIPNAMIIYGDYYNAYQFLLNFARFYGTSRLLYKHVQ